MPYLNTLLKTHTGHELPKVDSAILFNLVPYLIKKGWKFDTYMLMQCVLALYWYAPTTLTTRYGTIRYVPAEFTTLTELPMFYLDENLNWCVHDDFDYTPTDMPFVDKFLELIDYADRTTISDKIYAVYGWLPITEDHAALMCSQSHSSAQLKANMKYDTLDNWNLLSTNDKISMYSTKMQLQTGHKIFNVLVV